MAAAYTASSILALALVSGWSTTTRWGAWVPLVTYMVAHVLMRKANDAERVLILVGALLAFPVGALLSGIAWRIAVVNGVLWGLLWVGVLALLTAWERRSAQRRLESAS